MKAISPQMMQQFVAKALKKLSGDWVIMGGAVLPLLGKQSRVTLDIDLAGPQNAPQSQTLFLMEIAEQMGLPPEAINTAGAFFLHRISGWKEHLILMAEGKEGRIYRPDLWLFIKLKISRFSESDLSDCLTLLQKSESLKPKERETLTKEIKKELRKKDSNSPRVERLEYLLRALQ